MDDPRAAVLGELASLILRKAKRNAGFGHIAFSLPDLGAARAEVIARGGSALGEEVGLSLLTGEEVEWCTVADPEGNGIEVQTWR